MFISGFVYCVGQRILFIYKVIRFEVDCLSVSKVTEHSICFMIVASLCAVVLTSFDYKFWF